MANFWYTRATYLLATGALNLSTADLRTILVMTNTTADTQADVDTISAFTTLDQFDGTVNGGAYARVALTGETVTEDEANNRTALDCDNFTYTALAPGTRPIAGHVVYRHVTNDTDSIPLMWIDDGMPFTPQGTDVTFNVNAAGLALITSPNAP